MFSCTRASSGGVAAASSMLRAISKAVELAWLSCTEMKQVVAGGLFEIRHGDDAGDLLIVAVEGENGSAVLERGDADDDVGEWNYLSPAI